ncbi:MAG: hypothetical protein ACJ8D5_06665 [Sphingomicrobium sp.]
MVDEIFDRVYQDGRADLHAGIDRAFGRLAGAIGGGLRAMHRFEWSAPWHARDKRTQLN